MSTKFLRNTSSISFFRVDGRDSSMVDAKGDFIASRASGVGLPVIYKQTSIIHHAICNRVLTSMILSS